MEVQQSLAFSGRKNQHQCDGHVAFDQTQPTHLIFHILQSLP